MYALFGNLFLFMLGGMGNGLGASLIMMIAKVVFDMSVDLEHI